MTHRVTLSYNRAMNTEIVKEAVRLAGGTKKLADIAGVRSQAVSQWDQIPLKHVMKIEKALERKIKKLKALA